MMVRASSLTKGFKQINSWNRVSYSSDSAAVAKDYEEYRKSLYGEITHKAVLVDAAGTLFVPSQPMTQVYKQIGEKYGVKYNEKEILDRYRWAYEQPWGRSRLRFSSFSGFVELLESLYLYNSN